MLTGIWLFVALIVAIVVMILLISKYKIHPFISMLLVSIILGLFVLPIDSIALSIRTGFGNTLAYIGIVIILGALIGLIVEKTGGAVTIADRVVKLVGRKHPELAMLIMGWIVSIPVFCDSGFIILDPIRKALSKMTRKPSVGLGIALSLGLYAAHVFMPPTPGPIAAAGAVGLGDNLLLVMGIGVIVSIFALVPSYFFSVYIGKKVTVEFDEEDEFGEEDEQAIEDAFAKLKESYGELPNAWLSFAPIVVPIIAMAIGTIAAMGGWPALSFFKFIGEPFIALAIGVIFGVILLAKTGKLGLFEEINNENLKTIGPVLFITAMGGVLGKVITDAGVVGYIEGNADVLKVFGVLLPFLVAAILKVAQGSSTVAIVTTAALLGVYNDPGSLMTALGFTTPVAAALVVMAIGAGSMTVSHANDSYFWVVTNMSGMTPEQGYKTQTIGTLISGIGSIIGVLILSIFLI